MFVMILALGCGKNDDAAKQDTPESPSPRKPLTDWEFDPATKKGTTPTACGPYQLLIPKDYVKVVPRGALPTNQQGFGWKDASEGALDMIIIKDTKLADEHRGNPRQSIVNFTAGLLNTIGMRNPKHGVSETGTLGGLAFMRTQWTTYTGIGKAVKGYTYTATDAENVIFLIAIGLPVDVATVSHGPTSVTVPKPVPVMQRVIATFIKH